LTLTLIDLVNVVRTTVEAAVRFSGSLATVLTTATTESLPVKATAQIDKRQVSHGNRTWRGHR
jgi:hypothetical protein